MDTLLTKRLYALYDGCQPDGVIGQRSFWFVIAGRRFNTSPI